MASSAKRKRVSFGPAVSPELFDKALPPITPVRYGASPAQRRLSAPTGKSDKKSIKRFSLAMFNQTSITEESPNRSPKKSPKANPKNIPKQSNSNSLQRVIGSLNILPSFTSPKESLKDSPKKVKSPKLQSPKSSSKKGASPKQKSPKSSPGRRKSSSPKKSPSSAKKRPVPVIRTPKSLGPRPKMPKTPGLDDPIPNATPGRAVAIRAIYGKAVKPKLPLSLKKKEARDSPRRTSRPSKVDAEAAKKSWADIVRNGMPAKSVKPSAKKVKKAVGTKTVPPKVSCKILFVS